MSDYFDRCECSHFEYQHIVKKKQWLIFTIGESFAGRCVSDRFQAKPRASCRCPRYRPHNQAAKQTTT